MRMIYTLLITVGFALSLCKDCIEERSAGIVQNKATLQRDSLVSDVTGTSGLQFIISRPADDLTPAISGATIATSVLENKRLDIQITVRVANRLSQTSITADDIYDFHPVWEPFDRYILFDSYRGGVVGLWRLPLEQAEPESMIVPQSGMAFGASFSPDGRKIAFVECSNVYSDWWTQYVLPPQLKRPEHFRIMIYDIQKAEKNFAVFGITPAWSPRGDMLVYSASDGASWNIWMYDITKGERFPLVANPDYDDFYPCWSPDGNWIAFTRFDKQQNTTDICVAGATGGLPIVWITNTPDEVEGGPTWTSDGIYFHASRDGQKNFDIALVRNENLPRRISIGTTVKGDSALSSHAPTTAEPQQKTVSSTIPEQRLLRIKVLNSTRIPKLAAKTAELLESKGFTILEVGNSTSERNLRKGKIYYRPGHRDVALQIANIIPGVQLLVESSNFKDWDIVVVIGKNTQY